ncbi:MAG TPA: thioredoxin domain-containing protein, partial [Mycoplana sp.]|nr:thioredoxin domain-containing protein [Mycoplana sp.]
MTAGALIFAAPQLIGAKVVRKAMLDDPQILVDASDALRDKQYAPTLAGARAQIETPFASSWKGAEKPEVVLVEFYDYACPYCKASNPHVDQLVRENPKLRVVYRELPILGDESVTAARLSLTASKAGRFQQFHDALYAAGRPAPDT